MKKLIILVVVLFMLSNLIAQPINGAFSMFGNRKARRIDDVITVYITEQSSAKNKTLTDTEKGSSIGLGVGHNGSGVMKYLPNWQASGENTVDYRGKGETSRAGEFKAKVAVRVVDVFDNGNILINGSKVIEINNEKEIIHVSGIVRPMDISADNIVLSYNIADAKITYTGKGQLNNTQQPGLVTRFFTWLF